jgi:thioredoxin reductase (NADPH)
MIDIAALFVSIGLDPNTSLLAAQIELDAGGYVMAGEDTVTSAAGVFAAGDIRAKPFRQVVTAASDGAVAAYEAGKYLEKL